MTPPPPPPPQCDDQGSENLANISEATFQVNAYAYQDTCKILASYPIKMSEKEWDLIERGGTRQKQFPD